MKTTLYELTTNLIELNNIIDSILEDESLDEESKQKAAEEVFEAYLANEEDFHIKLNNCIKYIQELEALTGIRKKEAKRLNELAKSSESKAQQLRDYVTNHLSRIGTQKIELANSKVSLRKKPDELVLDVKVEKLPARFKRIKIEPDKAELRRALKETDLDCAHLEPSEEYSLVIK